MSSDHNINSRVADDHDSLRAGRYDHDRRRLRRSVAFVSVAFRPYEEMVALVDSGGLSRVVLDCAGVTFADSTALGMLLRMREHGRDTAIAFEIRNASAAI